MKSPLLNIRDSVSVLENPKELKLLPDSLFSVLIDACLVFYVHQNIENQPNNFDYSFKIALLYKYFKTY